MNPSNRIWFGLGLGNFNGPSSPESVTFVQTNFGTQSCPTQSGGADGCQGDGIFISLDQVRATTEDASPACVALYGPNIKNSVLSGQSNTCDLLFQDHTVDALLGKWSDLKCNQRTHSLICNLGE